MRRVWEFEELVLKQLLLRGLASRNHRWKSKRILWLFQLFADTKSFNQKLKRIDPGSWDDWEDLYIGGTPMVIDIGEGFLNRGEQEASSWRRWMLEIRRGWNSDKARTQVRGVTKSKKRWKALRRYLPIPSVASFSSLQCLYWGGASHSRGELEYSRKILLSPLSPSPSQLSMWCDQQSCLG